MLRVEVVGKRKGFEDDMILVDMVREGDGNRAKGKNNVDVETNREVVVGN